MGKELHRRRKKQKDEGAARVDAKAQMESGTRYPVCSTASSHPWLFRRMTQGGIVRLSLSRLSRGGKRPDRGAIADRPCDRPEPIPGIHPPEAATEPLARIAQHTFLPA